MQPFSSAFHSVMARLRRLVPGLGLSVILAGVAYGGHVLLLPLIELPAVLLALVAGISVAAVTGERANLAPGTNAAARHILRLGVALLGLRIVVSDVVDLGLLPVVTVFAGILSTYVAAIALVRLFRLDPVYAGLSGTGVAICGVAATLTAASVLPRTEHSERDTVLVCLSVTVLSTVAMLVYPVIAIAAGLDKPQASVFLGASIHDVAQVVAAGQMMSDQARDLATVTKLMRVAMLVPVAFVLAMAAKRLLAAAAEAPQAPGRWPAWAQLPWFLTVFVLLAAANATGFVPAPVGVLGETLASTCLIVAIAGLGLRTRIGGLMSAGWPPLLVIVGETVVIAAVTLTAVSLF